jgi:hypothetical protein
LENAQKKDTIKKNIPQGYSMSPTPTPSRFFPQLGKTELEGTSAFLDAQQIHLRENKVCGFIEIQVNQAAQVIFLFAPGSLAGVYLLEDCNSKPIQVMSLSTVWDGRQTPIRTVELPQIAGRMLWLALESPVNSSVDLGGGEWEKQLVSWKSESFSGVVEVDSKSAQQIFYVQEGCILPAEAVNHCDQGEFEKTFSDPGISANPEPLTVITHKISPASQAYQCLMLRQGMVYWGNGMLSRYQQLAGQKLIKMLQEDIKQTTQPWGWEISIDSSQIRDEHFFSFAQTAAQAYRAIFMEIGNQMDQVIGSAITQRILSETFETLDKRTRSALELHRLIPAAFSG